ncbi:transcription factor bHLH51-like [Malus sylvestris]|uniref:transcription factor bHLH51-like n=1 Tax=Malus sylvestris TaxID=3752 RepID=UPI0021AD0C78|nr:transcription factor bHLH51-like [Malus sylvestris]
MDQNYYYAGTGVPSWSHQFNSAAAAAAVSNESSSSFLVPWPPPPPPPPLPPPHVSSSNQFQFCGLPPSSWSSTAADGFEEDRAASASRSHSQAEKRRRDRINAQLATLRKLIPKSDKMDKAALLGSVIDHVKDLKRKAMEVSKSFVVPTEVDEVTIDCDPAHTVNSATSSTNKSRGSFLIRASVCCDDRPELFSELIQVLKGLKLTAVRADMASVGGRIKSVLVLCSKDGEEAVCTSTLKQSLKLVLSKLAASSMTPNCRIRSKRQRFFLPFHCPN